LNAYQAEVVEEGVPAGVSQAGSSVPSGDSSRAVTPPSRCTSPDAHPTLNFTVEQIENRLVAVLAPALRAKGGSVHSFGEWTLPGHGIVLVLSTGQEFWLTLAEASF
jgi:hypothetical protein